MIDAADILYGVDGGGAPLKPDVVKGATDDPASTLYPDQSVPEDRAVESERASSAKGAEKDQGKDAGQDIGEVGAEQVEEAAKEIASELELDPADPMTNEFSKMAAEFDLDAEQASKLVELELRNRTEFWEKTSADWQRESLSDSSINIDGAKAVLRRFGDETLSNDLTRFQFGNHPGFLRFLSRVAGELGE